MNLSRWISPFVVASTLILTSTAQAELFSADLFIDHYDKGKHTTTQFHHQFSFKSIESALDTFSGDFLQQNFSQYNRDDHAFGSVNLRGLIANFKYIGPYSSTAKLGELPPGFQSFEISIPDADIDKTFTGTNRDQIDSEVKAWFKDSGEGVVSKIYKAMVRVTPFDPVGGNPDSMMADMTKRGFAMGDTVTTSGAGSANLYNIDTLYANSKNKGNTVSSLSLPISYAHVFSSGKRTLFVDMPIHIYQYEDSQSYSAELGLGLKNQINRYWALTPEAYVGGVGSRDMGSLSLAYAGFLKSQVSLPYKKFTFNIENMGGYMQTQSVHVGDVNIDYGLKNWALDNGVGVGYRFAKYAIDVNYDHTTVLGSTWYIANYDTVKLSLAKLKKTPHLIYTNLSLDASYTFAGSKYSNFTVGMNYQFS